ncbi:uncharacterized protein LOC143583487 [Bidens hawaiensis]|uniref:uncharacterized protein LOC143583487 n=1 Tax=Bidens hawaiensis TaxID=980011 RepID=UPI00404BA12B
MSCGAKTQLETKPDGLVYFLNRLWILNRDDLRTFIMDEAHKSRYSIHPGANKMYAYLRSIFWWPGMKKDIALYVSKCLTCSKVKAEHHRPFGLLEQPPVPEWKWESIAKDFITKLPSTCNEHDSIWGVARFRKKGKLAPRFIGPFEILDRVGPVAYRLKLPIELSNIHLVFHASNLKKCLAEGNLNIPLDEVSIYETKHFVDQPVEFMDQKDKVTKKSHIPLVKVRWNSKQGFEFTWEREDQMKLKYSHLFVVGDYLISGRNS